jgi:ribonuclease HII
MNHQLTLKHERRLQREYGRIAGVDEVGRGCLAGPVVAAAIMFHPNHQPIKGVYDSKQIKSAQRVKLCFDLIENAVQWGLGITSVATINSQGISPATTLAMRQALDECGEVDMALIDGIATPSIKTYHFMSVSYDYPGGHSGIQYCSS